MTRRTLSSSTPRKRTVRTARPEESDVAENISATSQSSETKRQLILAHAATRVARDPAQIMSMWAGVVAVFVVIIGAWGYATIPGIVEKAKQPIPEQFTSAVSSVLGQFGTSASSTSPTVKINEATDRIRTLRSQIDEQQSVIDSLKDSTSTSARSDLFAGSVSSTSATSTESTTSTIKTTKSKK